MYTLTFKNFTHQTNSIPHNKRPFFAHMLQRTLTHIHTRAHEVYLLAYCRLGPRILLQTTSMYIANRANVTKTPRSLLHERIQTGARSTASAVALRASLVLLVI